MRQRIRHYGVYKVAYSRPQLNRYHQLLFKKKYKIDTAVLTALMLETFWK